MIGAPALAANGALRSGAGLVTVACPRSIQQAVAALCPCATSIPLPESRDGLIEPRAALRLLQQGGYLSDRAAPSVVAAGPGLGMGGSGFCRSWLKLLGAIGEGAGIPVVLDADGLNAVGPLAREGTSRAGGGLPGGSVLTPHPGELARLLGKDVSAVQADREGMAVEAVRRISEPASTAGGGDHVVVVLKGAGTIVTDGYRSYANKTGNPGMATGGSGDVLTGVIAALIGQGMTRFDASTLGVHVHGRAGDLAAKALGETSLMATDLIEYLPAAFRRKR